MKFVVAALLSASVIAPATAQVAISAPVATPPAPTGTAMVVRGGPVATNVLPQGTTVRLRTLTALSSNENTVGQRFDLETVDDVTLNGITIIPRGSHAVGEISFAKKKGMWGKSGRLQTSLISVRANGIDIPLRGGTSNQKGDTGTAGVVASIAVIPIAGFFVTGTSAVLPMGSPASGVTINDIPLAFAAMTPAAPSALPVAAPTPVVTPAVVTIATPPR